jgi:hypothetical protein
LTRGGGKETVVIGDSSYLGFPGAGVIRATPGPLRCQAALT